MQHSPPAADQELVNQKINALAIKAGFPKDFDLVFDSCGAIDTLKQVRDFEKLQRLVLQAQPLLKAVGIRAWEFMSALAALDPKARMALLATDPAASGDVIDDLVRNAERIQDAAEAALASLKAESAGRPGELRIRGALANLCSLYCEHCPDKDSFRSSASAPHDYEGEFFEFACQLLDLLEIGRSPSAIGKQIQLAVGSVAYTQTGIKSKKK